MSRKEPETNNHHLLYFRREWTKHEWSRRLRQHQACIVEVPTAPHNALHRKMWQGVPVASEIACQKAYEEVERLWRFGAIGPETDVEVRLGLLINLFGGNCRQTARALEQELKIIREIRGGG